MSLGNDSSGNVLSEPLAIFCRSGQKCINFCVTLKCNFCLKNGDRMQIVREQIPVKELKERSLVSAISP